MLEVIDQKEINGNSVDIQPAPKIVPGQPIFNRPKPVVAKAAPVLPKSKKQKVTLPQPKVATTDLPKGIAAYDSISYLLIDRQARVTFNNGATLEGTVTRVAMSDFVVNDKVVCIRKSVCFIELLECVETTDEPVTTGVDAIG